jgi:ethanolaminephosphotransferase
MMGKWLTGYRPAVSATVEIWYLRAYLVFAMIVYFRWALLVIDTICGYLGIKCLRIVPKDPLVSGILKERAA